MPQDTQHGVSLDVEASIIDARTREVASLLREQAAQR